MTKTRFYILHFSNKGAVAVSILFGSRSLLFINCHLTGIYKPFFLYA